MFKHLNLVKWLQPSGMHKIGRLTANLAFWTCKDRKVKGNAVLVLALLRRYRLSLELCGVWV